jgi:chemotaxis methyl-accepting protein methylase
MRKTLGRTIAFFLERHGVDLSVYDRSFLLKLLEARQARLGLRSPPSYLKHLEENALEAEELLQSTQVIYSEFFRNPLTFALLETLVLPCLVTRGEQAGHGEIRIWSTACAAGEEIYSTAMLLHDLFQV